MEEIYETLKRVMGKAKEVMEFAEFDKFGDLDVQTPAIQSIEELQELDDDTLLVYPAHDIDAMGITTKKTLEIMYRGGNNPTIEDVIAVVRENKRLRDTEKISNVLALKNEPYYDGDEKITIDATTEYWYFDKVLGIVEFLSEDVGTEVVKMITNYLRSQGVKIVRVAYGSPLHNIWNLYVGD